MANNQKFNAVLDFFRNLWNSITGKNKEGVAEEATEETLVEETVAEEAMAEGTFVEEVAFTEAVAEETFVEEMVVEETIVEETVAEATTYGKKKLLSPLAITLGVILGFYVISMVLPLLWVLLTTTKLNSEYEFYKWADGSLGNKLWWPRKMTLENYKTAYEFFYVKVQVNGEDRIFYLLDQFMNSILFSVGSAIAMTATTLVMGYASARFRYKFSEFIYMFVLVAIALPIVGSMPSEIKTAQGLGIFDTFPGIWIMRCTFLNTYFLIYYAQFKMIPMDYTEAAKIDGANPLSVMLKIIVPLASGTTTAVFVLNFIALWNDFQIPMVYLPSHPVAAYGMYQFQNTAIIQIANTPNRLAGICLMAFPIVVFYAFFNKKLNVNLAVGGIKG